jgi:hypothetical protein
LALYEAPFEGTIYQLAEGRRTGTLLWAFGPGAADIAVGRRPAELRVSKVMAEDRIEQVSHSL